MEKKIRVTLLKSVIDILEGDSLTFKISKNYLINFIFNKLKYENLDEYKELEGEKGVIQFNLNKENKKIYYEVLYEKKIQIEAEFIRNLIYKYADKPKNSREIFIFKEKVDRIKYAIDNSLVAKLSFYDGRKTSILPFYLGTSKLELSNYLFCYDLEIKNYKNYKLSNIDSIFITREKNLWEDMNFVEEVIKNFDPFLSQGKSIKAKLTKTGENLLSLLSTNRPEVISYENNIYTFKCSEELGKRYFSYFLDEIEILEPLSLREWFIEKYTKALKKYKSNS